MTGIPPLIALTLIVVSVVGLTVFVRRTGILKRSNPDGSEWKTWSVFFAISFFLLLTLASAIGLMNAGIETVGSFTVGLIKGFLNAFK